MSMDQAFRLASCHVGLNKSAADTVVSHGLSGRLILSPSGWLLLEVPNGLVRGAFSALHEPGVELPLKDGKLNAHISVMRKEEVAALGAAKITEIGKHFRYTLGPVKTVKPKTWDGVSKVWFIEADSPELRQLRKSYGLSALPNQTHQFHITFAVRKTRVLQANLLSKAAGLIDVDELVATEAAIVSWRDVPAVVSAAVKSAAAAAQQIHRAAGPLFVEGDAAFYHPATASCVLLLTQPGSFRKVAARLHTVLPELNIGITDTVPDCDSGWHLVKCGASYLSPLKDAWQTLHKPFGGPTPLSTALIGGALGAGAGYAGGHLLDGILSDEYFENGKAPKNWAMLGGLLGATPGLMGGALQTMTNPATGQPFSESGAGWTSHYPWDSANSKQADVGSMFSPTIPVDAFNQVVWNDVNQRPNAFGTKSPWGDNSQPLGTPAPVAAAATGLIAGASAARGGVSHVSVWDIASAGAISGVKGLIGGMIGGKALGALAGLKPEYQRKLQSVGMWGGLVSGAVGAIFGDSNDGSSS